MHILAEHVYVGAVRLVAAVRGRSLLQYHRGTTRINKPKTTAMVIIARWPHVSHAVFSCSTHSRRNVIAVILHMNMNISHYE